MNLKFDHRFSRIDELEIQSVSKLKANFKFECLICGAEFKTETNVYSHCKREILKEQKAVRP